MEQWKPIPGYPGYEASSLGRIRSLPRTITPRSNQSPYEIPGGILKQWDHKTGHKLVNLRKNAKQGKRLVHQVIAETFIGTRPTGLEVCHENGDPKDNRVENLRYDTHLENMKDIVRHGKFRNQNTDKTHCEQGHALEWPNIVPCERKKGWRTCRACKSAKTVAKKRGIEPTPEMFKEAEEKMYRLYSNDPDPWVGDQ